MTDCRTNGGDIFEQSAMDSIKNKLVQYKQNWLNHVTKMKYIRYIKLLLDYQSVGR
jgi:hypothetical protein